LVVDTLIAETNALSVRWMYGLDEMPVPYQCYEAGDFKDYILPDEGYTAEEVEQMEEERKRQASIESESMEALPDKEYEEKVVEMNEAVEKELKETKMILKAPPGADFVPGLDDDGESLGFRYAIDDVMEQRSVFGAEDERYGVKNFDSFLEAVEDEIEEAREKVDGSPGSPGSSSSTLVGSVDESYF
jgi:hypothetical protein